VFRYRIKGQRKTVENMGLLLSGAGDLVPNDMEKAKILNGFPPPCFLVRLLFRNPTSLRGKEARKTYPQWTSTRLGTG